jgi:hypothetical protein
MNVARGERQLAPLQIPWTEVPFESPCLTCHQGVESQRGTIFARRFDHAPHLQRARLECASCHRSHEERAAGEVVHFDAGGCDACHHREGGRDCLDCHEGVRERTFETEIGAFDHTLHMDEMGQTCTDCHELAPGGPARLQTDTCTGCHG